MEKQKRNKRVEYGCIVMNICIFLMKRKVFFSNIYCISAQIKGRTTNTMTFSISITYHCVLHYCNMNEIWMHLIPVMKEKSA